MSAAAVVVINYNGGRSLARCLDAARAQSPAELLVVDNASSDGSADALPPGVRSLRLPVNGGFAAGVIAGLAATHSPFVLTLNPDVELLPGALAPAEEALAADPALGSVALTVLDARDPERIDATGIGLTSFLGQINCDHGRRARELDAAPRAVLGPLGGAALWRRAALEAVGGPAPDYFLYWEDVDLALRLASAGYACRTVPQARALHEGGGSVGRMSARNVFYMTRNHWPCLLAALPAPLPGRRWAAFLLAPLRAGALYALRGRALSALGGLLCAPWLLPGALARRRVNARRARPDAGARLEELLASADRDRRAMRTAR